MIHGLKYWNDRSRFYLQTNNPTEEQLRKDELEEGGDVRGWLETCGPSMAVNLCAAGGHYVRVITPGGYTPQPEEVLADYFNDPANYAKFRKIRDDLDFSKVQGNRIPNLYPLALREVFGVEAFLRLTATRAEVVALLKDGCGVGLCLKTPGHFIAAVASDNATDEIIYHDSWPARTGTGGFALRMGAAEYAANVQDAIIGVKGEKA